MNTPKQSEFGTFIHFTKSCLATGILAMPLAFSKAGLLLGIFGTLVISLICTHCAYILVVCAQTLCKKTKKMSLTYADVAEEACCNGPKWSRKYGRFARKLVDFGIFATYFGICSAYVVIMAESFDKVIRFYWISVNIRIYIAILLVPLLMLSYIPNLKNLTPVSTTANLFMGLSLAVTFYYLAVDLPPVSERKLIMDITTFPSFFSITVFALEAIGAVMPLENNMKRPEKFLGVLNCSMSVITSVYIVLGVLGYLRFGEKTLANITLNLPDDEYVSQAIQILIGLSVFGTFGIQFFICLEIAWSNMKDRYAKQPTLANYVLRTIMVVVAVTLALIVPKMGPFISLIGALFFATTGILIPIIIEIITFWEDGFGKCYWIIIKDTFVLVAGFVALIVETKDALVDIIQLYN